MSPTPFFPFSVSNTPNTNATSSDDIPSSFRPGGSSNGRNITTTFGHGGNVTVYGSSGSGGNAVPSFNGVPAGATIPYDGSHSIFSGVPSGLTIPYDNAHSIFDDDASGTLTVTRTTSAVADATLIGSGRFPSTTITLPAPTTRAFDGAIPTATVFPDPSAATPSTFEAFDLNTSSPLPILTTLISSEITVSLTLAPTLIPLSPILSPSPTPFPLSKRNRTIPIILGHPNSLGYSPWHEWSSLPNTKLTLSFILLTLFLSWIMFGLCWLKRRQTRRRNAGFLPRRWGRSQEEDWEGDDEKGFRVISARKVGRLGSEEAESAAEVGIQTPEQLCSRASVMQTI